MAPAAEEEGRHLADLDLFRALGDAITAVVAVDVFERLVARIADAAMDLDGPVGRLADTGGWRNSWTSRPFPLTFDVRCGMWSMFQAVLRSAGAASRPGCQFGQRALNRLVVGQGLAEQLARRAWPRSCRCRIRRAQAEAAWRMRFWCTKLCASRGPAPSSPQHSRRARTLTLVKLTAGMVGGHVEGPHPSSTLTPGALDGDQEGR